MNDIFSDRISDVPKSFIREILKVAVEEDVISFAGGLPNRALFPVQELKEASARVLENDGASALQYSGSEGDPELRQFIADRYRRRFSLEVPVKNILITSGSQQGLDILGKTFINEGDDIIIEEPGYLGAIQAFSVYRANFLSVPLNEDGMDLDLLKKQLRIGRPKLLYMVPNFQNPSGISYTQSNRFEISEIIKDIDGYLIEDDPYGELRYVGESGESFKQLIPDRTILLGSFSKTVVPGFRLGWIVAPDSIYEKLLIAKQASDLHTNQFAQRVLMEYLKSGSYDNHVEQLKKVYGQQRDVMLDCINRFFPAEVNCTNPEGGMFLWVTLPEGVSSMDLFKIAIQQKVAFVPGHPFYIGKEYTNTLRLNFSNVDAETIEVGISRLGKALDQLLASS